MREPIHLPVSTQTVIKLRLLRIDRIQIGTIRPIRVDHTIFFKWILKLIHSLKRELKRRPIYERRCDERLKTKAEGSTRLTYTEFRGGLEHLKIETRLIRLLLLSDKARTK